MGGKIPHHWQDACTCPTLLWATYEGHWEGLQSTSGTCPSIREVLFLIPDCLSTCSVPGSRRC